jgi:hypothetical protein
MFWGLGEFMTGHARRATIGCSLVAAMIATMVIGAGALRADEHKDPYAPGTRNGPFVVTSRTLGELTGDGYQISGNLGTALVLQKGASVYSCTIPPDPEHLSYRSYFVCSELKEQRSDAGKTKGTSKSSLAPALTPELPPLKLMKPQH